MNNFVTDFRVIATRQDSWRGSNLSAPGLKQEGQNLKQSQEQVYNLISFMSLAHETQIEQQIEAVRLLEHYI